MSTSDYELIPMIEIDEEVKEIAISWVENYNSYGSRINIAAKHKLASDIMNYVNKFKYDFSKECNCEDSPGSTWCCNFCGLPITKKI